MNVDIIVAKNMGSYLLDVELLSKEKREEHLIDSNSSLFSSLECF